jgi:DNA-directed RNA polymerase specialized sigma24 family protein
MAPYSSRTSRFDADWACRQDEVLDAPLEVTAREALLRAARDGDSWLARLITAAQRGDELAGRCLVQAALGRLAAMARRDSRLDLDDLVGALWLRVMSYPLDRRPLAIISNLVLDARKDTLAEQRPLPVTPAPPARRHAVAADLLLEAQQIGVINAPMADVMRSVYVLGLSGEAAALRHGVAATTVRWRCSAGMRRLAQARELLV